MSDHLQDLQRAAGKAHDLLIRWQLVRVRIHHGLTIGQVADRTSWTLGDVIGFESPKADPTLGELRRYAMAVGAMISWDVVPEVIAEPEGEADR